MRVTDHREQAPFLRDAVDHPIRVEDLVPAVLGVRLREHHQFDVGRIAAEAAEIVREVQKALFRNVMYDLFTRLSSTRKRVIAKRQIEILKIFLDQEELLWTKVITETSRYYHNLSNPLKALVRDINYLLGIKALRSHRAENKAIVLSIRLDWPTYITETKFFEVVNQLPKGKTYSFLSED
jgi:hypothetical protein